MEYRPRLIDLFSGAGLFSGGLQECGFDPVLAIDVDKNAIASYNHNVAPCGKVGSVREIENVPFADVLLAGPPCQGFSTLGRRDPLDERNDLSLVIPLWAEAARAKIVVIENVPPFLKSPQWKLLTSALRSQGFEISTWELDAVNYGAPQRRRRSFTIASKVGELELPEALPGAKTILETFAKPISAKDPMHVWPIPSALAADRMEHIPIGGDKRDIMAAAPHLSPPSWSKMGCQATDVWGRMLLSEPANTLRCNFQNPSKGRYIHPHENRTISLREGARLQGVPDSWQFVGKPNQVSRQIGNGVPVHLGRAIGKSVYSAIIRSLTSESSVQPALAIAS